MRRRILLLALLLAGQAQAQVPVQTPVQAPARPRPAPPRRPPVRPADIPAPAAAPPPPPAPVAPVPAPPPPPINEPPVPLAPGISAMSQGAWRLVLPAGAIQPDTAQAAALRAIGARLAERSTGRVAIFSEVAPREGPDDDLSAQRRLSLDRARAVKAALQAGGLDGRRVDLRALGATPARRHVLDLMAPGVARP